MTSLEDLLWLYKMAVQFDLEAEKKWLKSEIDTRMAAPYSKDKKNSENLNTSLTLEKQSA